MTSSQYLLKGLSDFVRTESNWKTPTIIGYPPPLWNLLDRCKELREVVTMEINKSVKGKGIGKGEGGGSTNQHEGEDATVDSEDSSDEDLAEESDAKSDDKFGISSLRKWTEEGDLFGLQAICAGIRFSIKNSERGDYPYFWYVNFVSMYRAAWERMHHPDPLMRIVCPYKVVELHDDDDDDTRIEISELDVCAIKSFKDKYNKAVDVWCSMYEECNVRLVEENISIPRLYRPEQWHDALKHKTFVITGLQEIAGVIPGYRVEDIQNKIMYEVGWGENRTLTGCTVGKPDLVESRDGRLYERPMSPPSMIHPLGYIHLATIYSLNTHGETYDAYLYQNSESFKIYFKSGTAGSKLIHLINGKEAVYVPRVVTVYPTYKDGSRDALLLVQFVTQQGISLGIKCYRHNTTSTEACESLDLHLPAHDIIRCFDAWTRDGIILLAVYYHCKATKSARATDRIQVLCKSVERKENTWSCFYNFEAPALQSTFLKDRSSYPSLIRFERSSYPLLRIIYGGIIVYMDLIGEVTRYSSP